MILIRSNLHIIENKEEMVVNVTISCADRPLTTVKNKVSIAIKKRRSSVKPFNNGYILINLFIYSFVFFEFNLNHLSSYIFELFL